MASEIEAAGDAPGSGASRRRHVEVAADAELGTLIGAAFAECLRHLLANREPAQSAEDPEALHQLRVAVRRTRSALRLFADAIDRKQAKRVRKEIRWLSGRLSTARDWDVFVIETLEPVRAEMGDAAGAQRLGRLAEAKRRAAHAAVRKTLDGRRFGRGVALLSDVLGAGGWRPKAGSKRARRCTRAARDEAIRLLDDRLERVCARGRGIEQLSARDLHRLRIRVKQLRYAGELLAPVFEKKPVSRYLKRLGALQDTLGHLHDGRVAEELVEELLHGADGPERSQLELAADLVVGRSHRRARADRVAVDRAWARFREAPEFWRS
jgi:CHAD domain-containing protein